jgi:hypothetical protein
MPNASEVPALIHDWNAVERSSGGALPVIPGGRPV